MPSEPCTPFTAKACGYLKMFRSSDFAPLQQLLQFSFADPLSQQELLAMIQPEFDFADPASFAPHLLADPLPTTPPKQILVQESIDDAQVPNIATRVLARTIGVPGLDLEQMQRHALHIAPRKRNKVTADGVADATAARVQHDPDLMRLVETDFDEVIAAAERA